MKIRNYYLCGLAGLLGLALTVAPASATTIMPLDLEQMTQRSATVFLGKCTKVKDTSISIAGGQISAATYTFEVIDGIKNSSSKSVSFTQVKSTVSEVGNDGVMKVSPFSSVPTYKIGDELFLFLTRESNVGLCSPVALKRSVFRVSTADDGSKSITFTGAHAGIAADFGVDLKAAVKADGVDGTPEESGRNSVPVPDFVSRIKGFLK